MPSFGDSAFIFLLALLLFGPKQLPILARQLGKLMGDFRRASNEFRSQMEEELRVSEQAERQKEIAAIEAATPTHSIAAPAEAVAAESPGSSSDALDRNEGAHEDSESIYEAPAETAPVHEPVPIATSGELSIMPPSTGLPVQSSSSLTPFLDAIPAVPAPEVSTNGHGAPHHDLAMHELATHDLATHEADVETESLHG